MQIRPPPRGKTVPVSCAFRSAAFVSRAGFRGMLVANNHNGDFGLTGFEQTITALKEAGIAPIGGGPNLSGAAAPARFERNGIRVAVFGCGDENFCSPIATPAGSGICPWTRATLPTP